MSSYTEHLCESARARREAVENHMKAVASHAVMPLSASQLVSHINQGGTNFDEKENNPDSDIHLRTITKSRLKRLGVHYSDDGTMSSPIHRTEEGFCVEDNCEDLSQRPSAKSEARSARLARLASTINQWEDDLSHPTVQKPSPTKREAPGKRDLSKINKGVAEKRIFSDNKFQKPKSPLKPRNEGAVTPVESTDKTIRKPPTIVKYSTKEPVKREAPQPDQTPLSALDHPMRPKRIMWDSTIITSLENQGFERCESREHLVYDFKEARSPAKCLSPSRSSSNHGKRTPVSTSKKHPAPPPPQPNKIIDKPAKEQPIQKAPSVENKGAVKPSPNPVISKSPTKTPVEENTVGCVKKQALLTSAIVNELTPVKVSPSAARQMERNKSSSALKHESPRGHSRSPSPRKNTQVLEMAAQFEESVSPTKRAKETDPSELPLSQRKAMFEKNKGAGPLMPKAPLTMALPVKALTTPSPKVVTPQFKPQSSPARAVDPSEDKLKKIREEREKEMAFLRNRWEANKRRNEDVEPCNSLPQIQVNEVEEAVAEEEIEEKGGMSEDEELSSPKSIASTNSHQCPHTGYPMVDDVKRIKISPPKPGRLYPSISDIETETETESVVDNNNVSNSDHAGDDESMEESDTSSIGSLGKSIVKLARMSSSNLKRHNETTLNDTRAEEARVLGEIDEFLDEALGEPSPPKRSRDSSFDNSLGVVSSTLECGSVHSDSFEFTRSSTDRSLDTFRTIDSRDLIEPQPKTQLVHTISLYRRQKEMTIKSTTTVKRQPISYDESVEDTDRDSCTEMEQKQLPSEDELIANKIHEFLLEISKQQTVISQATQALNLCSSTIEFSGSAEQTEAERLLLIASQRRLALSNEVDRLRVEKKIHPNNCNSNERGDLTILSLTLPLKMDVIRLAAREERCYYVLVLVRSGATVLATEMLPALPKNLKQTEPFLLTFKTPLTLEKLYSDFTVSLEVYTLETRSKELLPHDIKYHITPSAKKTFVMPTSILVFRCREKMRMTPKKGGKAEASRLIMGPLESPGGPLAVRSSSFKLSGFSVFSLREINKTSFSLSKVQYGCVVEGSIQVKMRCEMSLEGMEYRGFLTMFQDVSGFGAWHRRWCFLKDNTISYWLYPEHEHTKVPLDTIDLTECCNEGDIGLVPRDVCARPNTFLLETIRSRLASDTDSLIVKTNKDSTLIRHLLSADTKEDRLEWCSRINQCLSLLRAWGKRPHSTIKHTQL